MFTPYKPCHKHTCFLVKVFDSNSGTTYWINRSFGNIKAVRNSYIHQKYWQGTVYYVYKYPSCLFVEAITYTDNKTRIILDNPEVKTIAGKYKEPCNKGEQTMYCVDKLITALQHPEEIERIESEDKQKELLRKTIKPSKEDSKNISCKQEIFTFNNELECYRSNHFEIVFTDYENGLKNIDVLRLSVDKAKLDKFSGKLTIYVYAIKQTLEYIDTLHEGQLYNIKYTLYNPDASCNFVILKRMMKLTEISFESYSKQSEYSLIRLDFSYV